MNLRENYKHLNWFSEEVDIISLHWFWDKKKYIMKNIGNPKPTKMILRSNKSGNLDQQKQN